MKQSNQGYVTIKIQEPGSLFRLAEVKCVPLYQTRIGANGEIEALVFQISGAGTERTHWIKRKDITHT